MSGYDDRNQIENKALHLDTPGAGRPVAMPPIKSQLMDNPDKHGVSEVASGSLFDLELPSILLTLDKSESKSNPDIHTDSTLTSEPSVTPRTSYNSLLHWGHSSTKNDVEYLLNKYSELQGSILAVEIPLSNVIVEIGHAKLPLLGLQLAGHKDLNQMSVFVCGLRPGSIAERDGRIEVGDQLLEVNGHTLYGLSHLNAAPIIRSIYVEAIRGSNKIFRKTKMGSIRFVLQRHESNVGSMAAQPACVSESLSAKSSRRSSTDTMTTAISTPKHAASEKARRSIEMMNLAFGDNRGPLVERKLFIHLFRGSGGFGFAIMEGSPTKEPGIYIKQIVEGGSAAKNGQLRPGDRLLRVNQKDATHASYDTVLDWIRAAKHEIRLLVSRWCYSSQPHTPEEVPSPRQIRLSVPQLLGDLTSAFKFLEPGHRSRKALSVGIPEPGLLDEDNGKQSSTGHLFVSHNLSQIRRASTPNLPSLRISLCSEECSSGMRTPLVACVSNQPSKRSSVLEEPARETTEPIEPPKTRLIIPGKEVQIELEASSNLALGMGCVGGSETSLNLLIIHEIYPNGMALKDGRLRPGDQVLQVNSIHLIGMPFGEAVRNIYKAYKEAIPAPENSDGNGQASNPEVSRFLLSVFRPEEVNTKWHDHEVTVELIKKAGKGLGLCVADRYPPDPSYTEKQGSDNQTPHVSYGVVITEVIRGSLAAADGRLLVKDQILSVNDEDVSNSTSELVGALLRLAPQKVVIKVGRLRNQIILPAFHGYVQPG
ncbi:multiple PDZ domain protein [Clonorchis sinensis]|uniref:Multiple PDZ domain protein n=1 Tax=Clonorchis sinensis TaxID=79923 RepID=G7YBM4_CLOSI|nr:multiple PDZ domain protein [Clonorchis sinensis]